jgi:hypothetical protein
MAWRNAAKSSGARRKVHFLPLQQQIPLFRVHVVLDGRDQVRDGRKSGIDDVGFVLGEVGRIMVHQQPEPLLLAILLDAAGRHQALQDGLRRDTARRNSSPNQGLEAGAFAAVVEHRGIPRVARTAHAAGPGLDYGALGRQLGKKLLPVLRLAKLDALPDPDERTRIQPGAQGQPGKRDVFTGALGPKLELRFLHVDVAHHLLQPDQRDAADQQADELSEDVFYGTRQERSFLQPPSADARHVALLCTTALSRNRPGPSAARAVPRLTLIRLCPR